MNRYWYDSWPGVKVETEHPVLDFFKTPYGGPDYWGHRSNIPAKYLSAFDAHEDPHAPYTTVSQNRGGPS